MTNEKGQRKIPVGADLKTFIYQASLHLVQDEKHSNGIGRTVDCVKQFYSDSFTRFQNMPVALASKSSVVLYYLYLNDL